MFPSLLGWMALIGSGAILKQLTFGHASPAQAAGALDPELLARARPGTWNRRLVRRLQAYAAGVRTPFEDVRVDPGPLTPLQRRILQHCRKIPYGKTLTYGELASKAGRPRAARAVGNCMANNRIPLVIPCHRVVAADGRLGGYSAPGGTRAKRQLLAMEQAKALRRRKVSGARC